MATEQLARLDIARNDGTPSPSPSYTHRGDSQETPSVTSQSEGEEDGPNEMSGTGSALGLVRKRVVSSSLLKGQHHLARESSTDTLEGESDAAISKTVVEKAWGPAPIKRRTKSWLSTDPDKTPGYEAPDQLQGAGGYGDELEMSVESDAETSEGGDEKRSIADNLPPEIILQVGVGRDRA